MSPKQVENTERVSAYINKAQLEALKIKAKERGMTVSGLVRLLIIECTTVK